MENKTLVSYTRGQIVFFVRHIIYLFMHMVFLIRHLIIYLLMHMVFLIRHLIYMLMCIVCFINHGGFRDNLKVDLGAASSQ